MEYDVLTFDTQAVETNGFHFDGGLLGQLKQFSNGPTRVVVAQIVASEILRHLREKTQEAKDSVEKAHKKALQYGLRAPGDVAFVEVPDAPNLARKRLAKYFEEIGATIISPDDVPMRDLVQIYVQAAPPFAASGPKKSEFPDAIALLSLEHWAKANNMRILAVSGDKDWLAFAEKCLHLDVVSNLSDALAKLQKDLDEANDIAQKLVAEVSSGENVELAEQFERYLRDAVESANVDAEASSYYSCESEGVEITFNHYEIDCDNGWYPAQVVQYGRSIIVVDVDLRAVATLDATFSLAAYDSVDRDYVGLGTTTARKEGEEIDTRVLVTFEGEFPAGEIEITNVEVIDGLGSIHFGDVEPDPGEPDYDDLSEAESAADYSSGDTALDEPF